MKFQYIIVGIGFAQPIVLRVGSKPNNAGQKINPRRSQGSAEQAIAGHSGLKIED
jgi:hypothetical protein